MTVRLRQVRAADRLASERGELVDVERERISLGIKQLEGDPFTNFIASHDKNSVVQGTVKSVDAKGAVIALTKVMAVESAPHKVLVNAIAPATVDTPMVRPHLNPGSNTRYRTSGTSPPR